jgi:8-oxo-dGTP pyrophosphatase MutT (NUDIX family)
VSYCDSIIQAAGGIIHKSTDSGEQIIVVHRRRHNDWTLPKGKLKEGESYPKAAIREAQEETGCVVQLGEYVGAIGYEANGIPKAVLFWRMSLVEQGAITDQEEVAEARWMASSDALSLLTHHQERELLSRVMPRNVRLYETPEELPLQPPNAKWPWLRSRRGLARLQREFEALRVEIAFLRQRSRRIDDAWVHAVEDQLKNVQQYLGRKDIEGGWYCLHSARRLAIFGLDGPEIADRARILREESRKLSSWRGKAVLKILSPDNEVTATRLEEALALRDEYAGNQYHKIWLMGDQLGLLLWISLGALVLLLLTLRTVPVNTSIWDYRLVATVLLVGVLGAGFSAAQSLIAGTGGNRIPERVANHFVTIARTFFGATAALAGYVLYQSGLFSIKVGDGGMGAALAIGFLFGYTGEKLISRIADSVSTSKSNR